MNRKLKKYLDDIAKTELRIAELQEHLRDLRAAQKQEEDLEMVRAIRSLKMGSKDLFVVLNGIQDGTMTITDLEALGADVSDADEDIEFDGIRDDYGYEEETESEGEYDSESYGYVGKEDYYG